MKRAWAIMFPDFENISFVVVASGEFIIITKVK